jgi:O-antigen ligase
MKDRCERCGLPVQRGEAEDYWLGGMMFNIVLSEMLALIAVAVVVLLSWPRVPWNAVWAGAVMLMIAAPFLLFPVSRTTWLAFDLLFRPGHESHYR